MKKSLVAVICLFIVASAALYLLYRYYAADSEEVAHFSAQHAAIKEVETAESESLETLFAEAHLKAITGRNIPGTQVAIDQPIAQVSVTVTDREQPYFKAVNTDGKVLSSASVSYDASTSTLTILLHVVPPLANDRDVNAVLHSIIWQLAEEPADALARYEAEKASWARFESQPSPFVLLNK